MKCKVCGKEFEPVTCWQRLGEVCSLNCWQDVYNETGEETEVEEDGQDMEE